MFPHVFSRALAVIAIATLVACATGPRRQTYWVNPQFGPEQQQQRFTLDSTECAALANKLIPEPPSAPQPQTGSITLNTPNGPVYGSYQQQPQVSQQYNPNQGALGGYLYGQRLQQRQNYTAACMANRGWEQRVRIIDQ